LNTAYIRPELIRGALKFLYLIQLHRIQRDSAYYIAYKKIGEAPKPFPYFHFTYEHALKTFPF